MWFSHLRNLLLAVAWTLIVSPTDTDSTRDDQPTAQSVIGREGETATLSCDLSFSKDHQTTQVIEWLHKGLVLPIFIKFGVHPPRIDAAYLGRLSLVEGASLRMERLQAQDEGWYRCRILFLTHPYDSQNGTWTYLSVSTPPSFRRTPPAVVEIQLGELARLHCDAQGRPQPLVSWAKDGAELPLTTEPPAGQRYQVRNGSLEIEAVGRGAAGLYTCEASNSEGSVTHTSRLLVRAPPVIVQPPSNLTVNYTQDALFTCHAEAYPGNLSYSWYRDSINVHHDSTLRDRVSVLTDGSLLVKDTVPTDSGHYTCVPTNGLNPPTEATASLCILHPAFTRRMSRLTVLPVGMPGQIRCPWVANPPLLYVNWTRNGEALDVNKVPGWSLDSAGMIVISMGNDDAIGEYSCTPYNSYGTLGESDPTNVILKDPPRFLAKPAPHYHQELGQELSINCSATGDPEARISWTKEGGNSPGHFQVLEDGTLFFRSIRKDHHGTWTCKASDNLTEITASTMVWVTGTSPHSVTNLTVRPDVFAVNVSWEPGFDGGHPQHFTVWFRQISRGSHDWIIRMVPDGHCSLIVDHLWSNTSYQFSVLAQSDRGSGPFSQIINTHTLSVPAVTAAPRRPPAPSDGPRLLLPPRDLVANRTARGVVLRWSAPPSPSRLPLAYVLEFRHGGAWAVLHSAIPAQEDQLLLTGLVKDVSYQFRMISLSGELVSEPSDIVNISTSGMSSYPSGETTWEPFTHSIRAGIIAGVCFLASAFIISILVSHVMRCRRRRRMQNVPIIFSRYQKSPNLERSDSPDSLLKLKLESSLYETFQRVAVSPGKAGRGRPAQYETHLGCLESIRRGADGRFVVQSEPEISPHPPPPAPPEPCPQAQRVQARALLRPKAHGQARPRPRACYFATATSSPADQSQPPPSPDFSPIAPRALPAPSQPASCPPEGPAPGPTCSQLGLGPVTDSDRGPDRGSSFPHSLESIPAGGLSLGPSKAALSLPGGRGEASGPGPTKRDGPQAALCSGSRPLLQEGSTSRCPSSANSEAAASSLAPNSSGYHSREASWRLSEDRSHNKREAPAKEEHEWDAGVAMGSEILEALRGYQRRKRPHSSIVLHDLTPTGCAAPLVLRRSGTVQSLEAPSSLQGLRSSRQDMESRCAALREEFQEYRRQKEREMAERARGNFELATLL